MVYPVTNTSLVLYYIILTGGIVNELNILQVVYDEDNREAVTSIALHYMYKHEQLNYRDVICSLPCCWKL